MSQLSARRLAWGFWALWLVLFVAAGALEQLNHSTPTAEPREPLPVGLGLGLLFFAFATVGALIVSRRPGNPIGWLMCVLGLAAPLAGVAEEYAVYALLTDPGSLPAGAVGAWLTAWLIGGNLVGLIAFLLLLFPTGRLASPRWRAALWANVAGMVLMFVWGLKPGTIEQESLVRVENPFGIEGAGTLLGALGTAGFLVIVAAAVAGLVSLVVRFRRGSVQERRQLKWFSLSGAAFCVLFLAAPLLWAFVSGPEWVWSTLFLVVVGTLPVSMGIAILRHNLYDIDLIIRRTLVYGVLTASLAGAYVGFVVLLQLLFQPVTQGSDLAIAGSTLAVAALFRPARGRIQAAVDRRFYRRRYDAARTLEAFSAHLREEVDLDALSSELRALVHETMQPAHVSLWLRAPEAGR